MGSAEALCTSSANAVHGRQLLRLACCACCRTNLVRGNHFHSNLSPTIDNIKEVLFQNNQFYFIVLS